jgi:NTE family protein
VFGGVGEAGDYPHEEPREGLRRAIVLSGGGARGAYEAGVLRYIYDELPARLGFVPRLDLYCGTSVGAVHACYLAAHADSPREGVRGLTEIWREMEFATVYRFGVSDALSFSRTVLGFVTGAPADTTDLPERIHGLLNTEPLERMVVQRIPWRRLRRNLRSRLVTALTVSATEIATGRTVVFVDNRERRVPSWTSDEIVIARSTRIGPEHALASAAIPFLFPAVRVGATYFCDGSLRQFAPLAPALRLGANRILVIGLRAATTDEPTTLLAERERQFLSAGFGPEHLERINRLVERERGLGFRLVRDCFIRPSRNIGTIAAKHVERMRVSGSLSWIGNAAFRALTRGAPEEEADLMSYLMFDGEYANELLELGRADAAASADELESFFRS